MTLKPSRIPPMVGAMIAQHAVLSGIEQTFGVDEVIVSKTDTKGRITYANRIFLRISGYHEPEVLGQPHSLIRHPEMPRGVFRLLWQSISAGREVFAYVINRCKNGDHYWVLAHVTPTFDDGGQIIGYHSNRRCPDRSALGKIQPVYAEMLRQESQHSNHRVAAEVGQKWLENHLSQIVGLDNDQFIFTVVKCGS